MIAIEVSSVRYGFVQHLLLTLGDKLKPEIAEAANRAAAGVRTDGKRLIAQQYPPLSQSEVADAVTLVRAHKGDDDPTAQSIFKGPRLPLYKFSPRPSSIMGGKTSGGVTALVSGKNVQFRHAFIANLGYGPQVFQRKPGGERFELYKMMVNAIPQMVEDNPHGGRIPKAMASGAEERFMKRFEQQVDRLLKEQGFE